MALKLKPALQYSQGRSTKWSGAKLINCFAERADGDKVDEFAVMATPGLVSWASLGTETRGVHVMGTTLYVASGSNLYSVASDGTYTLIGAIGNGSGPVKMADNGDQLAIAAGGVGIVLSAGILSTPVPFAVSDVVYADGYMLWVIQDSEQFIISSLGDATVYDPADIASVEGFPDIIVGAVNDHREIQFYGGNSTEIYYNAGAADMPFQRQGNAFIERGCFDRDSIVKCDNSVFFVGDDLVVYRLNGYQPVRISTHAIEEYLTNAGYARAFTYDLEGHKFYVLRLGNGTFVYDVATGMWHQRRSALSNAWRCNCATSAYGQIVMGSDEGNLYHPDPDVFTENGRVIMFDVYLPTIEAARERVTMYSFEVYCETGVGNADVANPHISLRYSDDGGYSFSNFKARSLGTAGDYQTRAIWRSLGRFRQRQIHIRLAEACRRTVINYWAVLR